MPASRSLEINGLISLVRITVSPRHKARPSLLTLSKEIAAGIVRNDLEFLPNILTLMLVLDFVAVHTPLIT